MEKAAWKIEMLGGFRVRNGDREPVVPSRQQTGTLFAHLALNLNQAHPRESLLALIWPEDAPEEASHRLRQALYVLRRQLAAQSAAADDLFLASRTVIQLNPALIITDVCQFEQAVQAAEKCAFGAEKLRLLQEAVSIYKGELLPGMYLEEFEVKRRSLAEMYRSALHGLMQAHESVGDPMSAIETGNRALALDPLMEEAHCDLMRLYAADGQPSAVIRQYQVLAAVLKKELGETPSQATSQLMESLRQRAKEIAAGRGNGKSPLPQAAEQAVDGSTVALSVGPPPTASAASSMHRPHVQRNRLVYGVAAVTSLCLLIALQPFKGRNAHSAHPPADTQIPSGTMLWTARYQPKPKDKSSEAVAVIAGPNDGVYVTGFVDTSDHDVDFLTLRYDRYGTVVWEARYNGPGNDLDRAVDIARDSSGCVYVTGESDNGKGNGATRLAGLDFATIKYDENGNRLWVRRYNGPEDGEDRPVHIKVDGSGVYVLGKSWGKGKRGKDGFQYALVKYSLQGNEQWVVRYDGGSGDDEPVDMALDPDGSIYVTGQSAANTTSGREFDMLTLKISKDGKKLWEARYGANNRCDDCACKIGLDGAGNVYVVGTGIGMPGTPDADHAGCITLKYDSSGKRLWARGTCHEADRIDKTWAALLGSDGEVIACGKARDKNGSPVARIVSRDANGMALWSRDVFSLAGEDGVSAISGSADGVFLCGGMRNQREPVELCTVRYSNNGDQVWRKFLDAPVPGGRARAITLDRYTIVVGKSMIGGSNRIVVIRYQP